MNITRIAALALCAVFLGSTATGAAVTTTKPAAATVETGRTTFLPAVQTQAPVPRLPVHRKLPAVQQPTDSSSQQLLKFTYIRF